jgi:hypothetical protein
VASAPAAEDAARHAAQDSSSGLAVRGFIFSDRHVVHVLSLAVGVESRLYGAGPSAAWREMSSGGSRVESVIHAA